MKSKLVRDLIPQIIEQEKNSDGSQRKASFYRADDQEYLEKLKEKLLEEAYEFVDSEEIVELADLYEVLEALLAIKGVSLDDLVRIKNEKVKKSGSFKERIILYLDKK